MGTFEPWYNKKTFGKIDHQNFVFAVHSALFIDEDINNFF